MKRNIWSRNAQLSSLKDGMAVGLGTGTTATMFIRELADRVQQGLKIRCVASSDASHDLGLSLGMDVTTLDELPELDLYIDGADEVGPGLALIKGGGGALLREKIVDECGEGVSGGGGLDKDCGAAGEISAAGGGGEDGAAVVEPRLAELGLNPKLRRAKSGDGPYLTDEGNYILDCACGVIDEPEELAAEIRGIVGVVEHGLFLGMATLALVAGEDGVTEQRG